MIKPDSTSLFTSIDESGCESLQGGNGMSCSSPYSFSYQFSKAPGQLSFGAVLTTPLFTVSKSFSFSTGKTMIPWS